MGGLTGIAIFKYEEYLARKEIRKNWANIPTHLNGIGPGMTMAEASALWRAIQEEGFDISHATLREAQSHLDLLAIEEAEWDEGSGAYETSLEGANPLVALSGDAPDELEAHFLNE